MSKLQKALGMLRSKHSRDGTTKPGIDAGARLKHRHREVRPMAGGSHKSAGEQADGWNGKQNEQPVQFSIEVDLEGLVNEGLLPREADRGAVAQQFRRIKRPVLNLAFGANLPKVANPNVIMITSALPRSGKTFCALNLAISISHERDLAAVLVDADVLKPNITRSLGLESRPGLIEHLLEPEIGFEDILVDTDLQDLVVVPAGRQHGEATELLASRRMKAFISKLSERFPSRAIIVDTPPLLITNEAQVLAEHMGQIVVVIEAGVSTHDAVLQTLASLNRDKPINAILNKARDATFGAYGGGDYGYYSAPKRGYGDENQEK